MTAFTVQGADPGYRQSEWSQATHTHSQGFLVSRQLSCLDSLSMDGPQGEEMSDDEDDKH